MYEGHRIAVVVPAYNEAERIGDVIETMPSFVDRVYAVDDCSTDTTWAEINRYLDPSARPERLTRLLEIRDRMPDGNETTSPGDRSADADTDETIADGSGSSPQLVPISHDANRGVGAAIMTGYEHSLADGMDITAVMAGDGQMDPTKLESLLEPIVDGRVDYAKGNRLLGRKDRQEMSRWRRFGNLTLTFLTKVATGYWGLMDPQNGYTAISREALEAIEFDRLYERYGFTNDLLVMLNTNRFRVADVAMPAVYGSEESHIRYRSFVPNLSWLLCQGFAYRLYRRYLIDDFHPLTLLYGLGVAGGMSALTRLALWVRDRQTASERTSGVEAAGAGAVLWLLSALTVVLAMIFDRLENDGMVIQLR